MRPHVVMAKNNKSKKKKKKKRMAFGYTLGLTNDSHLSVDLSLLEIVRDDVIPFLVVSFAVKALRLFVSSGPGPEVGLNERWVDSNCVSSFVSFVGDV